MSNINLPKILEGHDCGAAWDIDIDGNYCIPCGKTLEMHPQFAEGFNHCLKVIKDMNGLHEHEFKETKMFDIRYEQCRCGKYRLKNENESNLSK